MDSKVQRTLVDTPRSDPAVPHEPDADPKQPKQPIEGEQPLADDETEHGGIDGAVGGGQSGQGGG
jgi:hypothetical protein